jgi:hypothetical protein
MGPIDIECRYDGRDDKDGWTYDAWKVTLTYGDRQATIDYGMGTAHEGKEPTLDEVLYAIQSDSRAGDDSFDEFCDAFGYDTDSRKAYADWEACKAQRKTVARLFGRDFHKFMSEEYDA